MKMLAGILAAFPAMEWIAWAAHKWLMHGPLWSLHKSHHGPRHGALEANDAFGFFFSGISIALILRGLRGRPFQLGAGLGMALYGLAYLWVHDTLAHGRFGRRNPPGSAYLRRLVRAHREHHCGGDRDGTRNFGFLKPPGAAAIFRRTGRRPYFREA